MKNTVGTPAFECMKGSITSYLFCVTLLCSIASFSCNSQKPDVHTEKDRLTLVSKIVLPNVAGRIDHIAFDAASHRAFIAALGNNSVEVVDIVSGKVIHSIKSLHQPQGVAFVSALNKLVIANGTNGECSFVDGSTYVQSGSVRLEDDADNVRYDSLTQLVYVGYGGGAIAIIDLNTLKQVANIPLDGHPESFQISRKLDRIYINVPDAMEVEVAELSTRKIIAKWSHIDASANFPMALDEDNNRLFIGCRRLPALKILNATSGEELQSLACASDVDDVFYRDSLVFVSGGGGFIDVFRAGANSIAHINHIKTRVGARTSLLLALEGEFLLALPERNGEPAALWIYKIIENE